jgi:SSS family solute:Na+ symporter
VTDGLGPLLAWLVGYGVVVLAVGLVAARRASRSPEEYFLAGRNLGTPVLFMALFGTNCTAFVLVGVPGQAYRDGIGIFGVNAPIVALGVPLTFLWIGAPARRMAKRLGALTPAELFALRFGSRAIGMLLFAGFTLYTLPYIVLTVKGAALTLDVISGGRIPVAVGAAFVLGLTVVYTSAGGMRSTAWTNVLQGLLFMGFLVAAFFLMSRSLGGLPAAMEAVRATDPDLLRVAHGRLFEPRAWASWGLVISLTVIAFPHMLARLLAARDDRALANVCRMYPLALALLWIPAVLIGVWAAAAFPGLERPDRAFSLMSAEHLPAWMGPASAVVVLAAGMSTLDAMILTLSSMLVRDVTEAYVTHSHAAGVLRGRVFGLLVAATVYVLTLVWGESVFRIGEIAFSGYVTLAPTLALGVRWKRFTCAGAFASILTGNGLLVAGLLGWIPLFGFLPVFPAFVGACLAGWLVSLATPDGGALARRAFGESDRRLDAELLE